MTEPGTNGFETLDARRLEAGEFEPTLRVRRNTVHFTRTFVMRQPHFFAGEQTRLAVASTSEHKPTKRTVFGLIRVILV
jgi:hypothetical protein